MFLKDIINGLWAKTQIQKDENQSKVTDNLRNMPV